MGLGSTARKLQELADAAEKLFRQLSDLRDRVQGVEDAMQSTAEDVSAVQREQRRQRALLEAVGEAQGVDVDAVVSAVDAELDGSDANGDEGKEGEDAGTDAGSGGEDGEPADS